MPASSGAIRAGKAFVEMSMKDDSLRASLRGIGTQFKTMASGVASIAAAGATGLAAVGAAAVGAIAAAGATGLAAVGAAAVGAVVSFAKSGAAIDDMAQRTGVSAEALQELGYAARQSGTDSATLEGGFRKMQQTLADAAGGSKEARAALTGLGLSVDELQGMAPDKQFDAIAQAISGISDPAQRTAAAMDIFGKSGAQLLPMMGNLQGLRDEAQKLGLVMSGEDVAAAAKLDDTLSTLWDTLGALKNAIGAALAGPVQAFADLAISATAAVTEWINKNREVFDVITEISQLLASGEITAAADLFWAGLNLAWLSGTEELRDVFRIASNNLASIFFDLLASFQSAWVQTVKFLSDTWRGWQNSIAGGIASTIAKLTGQDPEEVLATLKEMQQQESAASDKNAKDRLDAIEAQRQATMESLDDELQGRRAAADAALEDAKRKFAETRGRVSGLLPGQGGATSPGVAAALAGAASASSLSAGFGSFSTAGLGQIGISGVAKLEDYTRRTAEATEAIAAKEGQAFT